MKTTLKLDPAKMLGYRLNVVCAANGKAGAASSAKLGLKAGEKLGLKVVRKAGAKVGVKPA